MSAAYGAIVLWPVVSSLQKKNLRSSGALAATSGSFCAARDTSAVSTVALWALAASSHLTL